MISRRKPKRKRKDTGKDKNTKRRKTSSSIPSFPPRSHAAWLLNTLGSCSMIKTMQTPQVIVHLIAGYGHGNIIKCDWCDEDGHIDCSLQTNRDGDQSFENEDTPSGWRRTHATTNYNELVCEDCLPDTCYHCDKPWWVGACDEGLCHDCLKLCCDECLEKLGYNHYCCDI